MIEPKEVSLPMRAFPAGVIREGYLPPTEEIPKEFWEGGNEWVSIASQWFSGKIGKDSMFYPKDSIDAEKAFHHCNAVMGSYEPKHEHKIAGVGFLMSQFFEKVEI